MLCVGEHTLHISNNTWFLLNSGAVILEQSMGARNRVGIDVVVPARRGGAGAPGYIGWSLVDLINWNRFLGSLKVKEFRLWNRFLLL
jgi:hypothetical protein